MNWPKSKNQTLILGYLMNVPALLLTLLTLAELDIVFLDLSVLVCVWFR